MKLYFWDEQTKIFTKTKDARPNPRRHLDFLKPTNSTFDPIPSYGEEERPKRTDERWVNVLYKVGQNYYEQDGTKHTITEPEVDVPDGCVVTPPPSIYHDTHDGTDWLENPDLIAEAALQAERDQEKALSPFAKKSMSEIEAWVEDNVIDLPSAKQAITYLAKAVKAISNL